MQYDMSSMGLFPPPSPPGSGSGSGSGVGFGPDLKMAMVNSPLSCQYQIILMGTFGITAGPPPDTVCYNKLDYDQEATAQGFNCTRVMMTCKMKNAAATMMQQQQQMAQGGSNPSQGIIYNGVTYTDPESLMNAMMADNPEGAKDACAADLMVTNCTDLFMPPGLLSGDAAYQRVAAMRLMDACGASCLANGVPNSNSSSACSQHQCMNLLADEV